MMPTLIVFFSFVGMVVLGVILGRGLLKSLALASWLAFIVALTFMIINGLGEPVRVSAIEDKPIDEKWYPFFVAVALFFAGIIFSILTLLTATTSGSKKVAQTLVDYLKKRSQQVRIQIIQPGEDWRQNRYENSYKYARRERMKERIISGTIVGLVITLIYWAFGFFSQKFRDEWEKRVRK